MSALCRPTLFLLHFIAPMLQKECFSDCANNKRTDKNHKWKKQLGTEVTCQCFANITIIYF